MRTPLSDRTTRRVRLARHRGLLAGLLVAAAVTVAGPGSAPASAAESLPMRLVNPSTGDRTGNEFVRPSLQLSAPCPAAATTFYARLHGGSEGARFPELGGLIKVPGYLGMSLSEPFAFETELTFLDTAQEAGFAQLAGRYRVEVVCQDDFSNVLRRFETGVRFLTAHSWVADRSLDTAAAPEQSPTPAPTESEPAARSADPPASAATEPTIEVRDATGVPLGTAPVVRPGQTVRVTAGGFVPGQRVRASFGQGSRAAVEAVADGNGVVTYGVTVPDGAGRQTFTVTDGSGRRTLTYRVAGEALTGSTPLWQRPPVLAGAVGLVLLVLAGLVAARRPGKPSGSRRQPFMSA